MVSETYDLDAELDDLNEQHCEREGQQRRREQIERRQKELEPEPKSLKSGFKRSQSVMTSPVRRFRHFSFLLHRLLCLRLTGLNSIPERKYFGG
jgi:hypothetical protein